MRVLSPSWRRYLLAERQRYAGPVWHPHAGYGGRNAGSALATPGAHIQVSRKTTAIGRVHTEYFANPHGHPRIQLVQMDEPAVPDEAGKLHEIAKTIEAYPERYLTDEEDLAVPSILDHRLRG